MNGAMICQKSKQKTRRNNIIRYKEPITRLCVQTNGTTYLHFTPYIDNRCERNNDYTRSHKYRIRNITKLEWVTNNPFLD